jgi:hypothetical protein
VRRLPFGDYNTQTETPTEWNVAAGQASGNPIAGKYYDWPVGYEPGKNLSDYWSLED